MVQKIHFAAALLFRIIFRVFLFKIVMFLSEYFGRRTPGNFLIYFVLLRGSDISDLKLDLYNLYIYYLSG